VTVTFVHAASSPGDTPGLPGPSGRASTELSGTAGVESAASIRALIALRSW
jgi:hypothetical protein